MQKIYQKYYFLTDARILKNTYTFPQPFLSVLLMLPLLPGVLMMTTWVWWRLQQIVIVPGPSLLEGSTWGLFLKHFLTMHYTLFLTGLQVHIQISRGIFSVIGICYLFPLLFLKLTFAWIIAPGLHLFNWPLESCL